MVAQVLTIDYKHFDNHNMVTFLNAYHIANYEFSHRAYDHSLDQFVVT